VAGASIALLVVAGAAATRTPLFAVRHVEITGMSTLTRRAVLETAGIHTGSNVFQLDASAAEGALLTDPWVREASITRDLPGTVRIVVTERLPVGTTEDGSVVASDGVTLPGAARRGLPSIRTSPDTLAATAGALGAIPAAALPQVDSIRSDPADGPDGPDGMELTLRGGTVVIYGSAESVEEKGAALASLLDWLEAQGDRATQIDLRSPTAPTAILGADRVIVDDRGTQPQSAGATPDDVSPVRTTPHGADSGSA